MKESKIGLAVVLGAVLLSARAFAAPDPAAYSHPVSENVRGHENTEWSTAYAYHMTDKLKNLPRVLLVGDSICNAYQGEVRRLLEGKVNVSYWISSYCVTSPNYRRFLSIYLDETKYDVIHFNNGLHSLGTPAADYEKGMKAALDLIREKQPKARIVWASSTPLKDAKKTGKVRELNAAGERVFLGGGDVVANDLFALVDPFDRAANWRDMFHHKPNLVKREGAQVADVVLAALRLGDCPRLMETFGGAEVKDVRDWERVRAPEILECYSREVFGVRPKEADERGRVSFEVTDVREAMDGKAIRKLVTAKFAGPRREFSFTFTVFVPKSDRKVPAFVFICNRAKSDIDPDRSVKSGFWPAEEIVARGYATAAFQFDGVARDDSGAGFDQGVFPSLQDPSARDAESWASISAWAWGASRILDWMETEPLIDAKHVGVVGHSRGGKTAIWTGVTDKRFAMACSNDSGCSGAKLNHMNLPRSESIAKITKTFPHWFCANYRKYAGREREMDFDQHELLALIAPRLLCVASATKDDWAGQEGEWWSAKLASPAWELYGKRGLVEDRFPRADAPQQKGCVSYHLRTGKHDLTPYDWKCYMDFADAHGWRSL